MRAQFEFAFAMISTFHGALRLAHDRVCKWLVHVTQNENRAYPKDGGGGEKADHLYCM